MTPLERIVSGGQTGADRGGLDAAIALGLAHGGWCPKGRRAEDGPIPGRYALRETATEEYEERTEQNVIDSDGTVIFTFGEPTGGSLLTLELAKRHRRPHLHLDLENVTKEEAARRVRAWVDAEGIAVLNVAGSREGKAQGIRNVVWEILKASFG